jgi:hypothetical protein
MHYLRAQDITVSEHVDPAVREALLAATYVRPS